MTSGGKHLGPGRGVGQLVFSDVCGDFTSRRLVSGEASFKNTFSFPCQSKLCLFIIENTEKHQKRR